MIKVDLISFPKHLLISGNAYEIYTDYRIWIKVAFAFRDIKAYNGSFGDFISLLKTLHDITDIVFVDKPPLNENNISDVMLAVSDFLCYYKNNSSIDAYSPNHRDSQKDFDLFKDGAAIYASFLQSYGIRLHYVENMHWHEFVALLCNLGSDTPLGKLIWLRNVKESDIPEDCRAKILQAKKRVSLCDYDNSNEMIHNLNYALKNFRLE